MQTGYHLWLLYFYDRRPIQYIERSIDSCLKTQNLYGGFGVPLNSSACEDIDSIDPLIRLSLETDYRKTEIMDALKRALPWILVNMNSDGGWGFRRYEAFQYGLSGHAGGKRRKCHVSNLVQNHNPGLFGAVSHRFVHALL